MRPFHVSIQNQLAARLPASLLLACLLLACLLLCAGCGGAPEIEIPQTHPAGGKVLKAGQPLTAGTVEFQPQGAAGQRASGEIQPDGTFSLSTIVDVEKVAGAVPGQYKATVIPPIPADQNVQIFNPPDVFTVEAKDNQFTIQIP